MVKSDNVSEIQQALADWWVRLWLLGRFFPVAGVFRPAGVPAVSLVVLRLFSAAGQLLGGCMMDK